ncbi:MAG: iron-containing redox enzyme family protein [Myxococcota bacterium]
MSANSNVPRGAPVAQKTDTLDTQTAQDPTAQALTELQQAQRDHTFWDNSLLKAFSRGQLTISDIRIVFEQYYLYSKNFTRYLSALMTCCEDDLHRAQLAENLWEEGGMLEPSQRHAEMFRRFLTDALDIDLDAIEYTEPTKYFVREYLSFCRNAQPAAVSAFLSLGTEAMVARLYGIMVNGMLAAGVPEEQLGFFRLHMECDDEHAETIENIMLSYAATPGWYEVCYNAMDLALTLRQQFFENLYALIKSRRIESLMSKIQDRQSLAPEHPDMSLLHHRVASNSGQLLYRNRNDRLNIELEVERVEFPAEVFDTRVLRIPAGKNNELHKHPHESIFYVVQGRSRLHINDSSIEMAPGDLALVPRWAMHQTHNIGDETLVVVAITDFKLTDKAFIGNHLKTTRSTGTQAKLQPRTKSNAPLH